MSNGMNDWTAPDFLTHLNDDSPSAQTYVDAVTAFLNKHPAGTIFPSQSGSVSDERSPSSSSNSSAPNANGDGNASADLLVASSNNNDDSAYSTAGRHDKRKTDASNGMTIKDRRSSGGNKAHTHTHGDVDDVDSEDDGAGSGGHGGPGGSNKKGKTSDRRRAQNRQAQRNFRERKEKHLKELEERVVSLEQQTNDQLNENSVLKQLVQRLQSENERLKVYESAFSFSYDKDVSRSSAMPKAPAFGGAPLPPPPEHPRQSSTSSTSSSPSASREATYGGATSDINAFSLPPTMSSSMAATPTLGSISPAATQQPTNSRSAFDDSLFMGAYAPSPASTTGESAGSSNHVATPPENALNNANADLFRAYREPSLTQFDDLDALFASVAPASQGLSASSFKSPIAGLSDTGSTIEDFSRFLKSPSPMSAGLTPPSDSENVAQLPTKDASAAAMHSTTSTAPSASCPLTNAPPAGKFVFDVDGLCADMKAKATCQEAARRALAEAMKQDADTADKLFNGPSPTSS